MTPGRIVDAGHVLAAWSGHTPAREAKGIVKADGIIESVRVMLGRPVPEDGIGLGEAAYTPVRRGVVAIERLSHCGSAAKKGTDQAKASQTWLRPP